ncbi:hypothetical protein BTVI_159631 [Pitangus sulphuratus]|nr:hypothetical protein BTVI_159631 [Pitangus sulphuratus]
MLTQWQSTCPTLFQEYTESATRVKKPNESKPGLQKLQVYPAPIQNCEVVQSSCQCQFYIEVEHYPLRSQYQSSFVQQLKSLEDTIFLNNFIAGIRDVARQMPGDLTGVDWKLNSPPKGVSQGAGAPRAHRKKRILIQPAPSQHQGHLYTQTFVAVA